MPAKLVWDADGARKYESGVEHVALFVSGTSSYNKGVAWNGVTSISEKPEGGDSTALYADNIKYIDIQGVETFGFTISAYTYPDEWEECDGYKSAVNGVTVGQQSRKSFALAYETREYNDTGAMTRKIHLVWGAKAEPSDRNYKTINSNPDAIEFSWTCKATGVANVDGMTNAVSHMIIDCASVDSTKLATFENGLWGSSSADATMPTPAEVISAFTGT